MVYEDTAERHRFDSFCKVVLRHAMLDCFREFSYQNKWLVSLNYLPQPIMDEIYTTDQYPSDYITFSADGYTLQISNEQLANIIGVTAARATTFDFVLCAGTERPGNRQEDVLFQKCHSAPPYKCFAEYAGTTDEETAMKESSGKYKPPPLLSVIEAARAGEADAMEQILQHYDAYINKLCLRTMVDESGQTHKQVDPYMKGRLQSKLMQAITKK